MSEWTSLDPAHFHSLALAARRSNFPDHTKRNVATFGCARASRPLKIAAPRPLGHQPGMKFTVLLAIGLMLSVGGCESISEATSGVRERVAARSAPQIRTFQSTARATYDAVRSAATEMGYRF